MKERPYDPVADFTPISMLATVPNVLLVTPKLPANSVRELIASMKSGSGTFSYASSGVGSPLHLAGELFKLVTGTNLVHIPYKGVQLTDAGERLALEVIRHHRLLELYLAESLDVPWDRVHAEAEVLEHVLSEELEELISAKLGHPTVDPHGDPIPTAELEIAERRTEALSDLEPRARATFVRISDSDPEMLRYLADRGIAPGDDFEVLDKQPFDGPIFARFGDQVHVLGGALAKAMRVELAR
jgi:DtxR family Mn-dependent transcriptional regulator